MKRILTCLALVATLTQTISGQGQPPTLVDDCLKRLDTFRFDTVYPLDQSADFFGFAAPQTGGIPGFDGKKLLTLLGKDLFVIFPELARQYSTELQRKKFLASEEYARLSASLNTLLEKTRTTPLRFQLSGVKLADYDLTSHRFLLSVNRNFYEQAPRMFAGSGPSASFAQNLWNWFVPEKKVSFLSQAFAPGAKELQANVIAIDCPDEDLALAIENARTSRGLSIVAAVTLTGKVVTTDFSYYVGRSGDLTPQSKSKDLQKGKQSSTDIEIASLSLSFRSSRDDKEFLAQTVF
jgi:hypothetical protein